MSLKKGNYSPVSFQCAKYFDSKRNFKSKIYLFSFYLKTFMPQAGLAMGNMIPATSFLLDKGVLMCK